MQIDWFTFAAQIVNFLILLVLLKRFLYGPILKAIDDREAEIASGYEEMEERQNAADSARDHFETKTRELTHAKQKLLSEAAEECQQWKSERLAEARSETNKSRSDWFAGVDRERVQLKENLLSQYRQHSLQLAEGIISCLADQSAQDFLVDAFVRRLQETDSKALVKQLSHESAETVTLRSAFELSSPQQSKLKKALAQVGYSSDGIQFRLDESLICGVELRTSDHEISWNVRESLDFLAADFSRDLDAVLTLPVGVTPTSESVSKVSHAT